MEDLQDNLSIVTIKGEGVLVESTKKQGAKIPCNICIQQLYNGRIQLEFNVLTNINIHQKWSECYGPLDFVGKSNEGDYLQIKNFRYADVSKSFPDIINSSLKFRPESLEILHQPESEAYQLQTATCEITNLYLERTNSFEINLPEANIQIQQNPDKYATVANLMRLTGTSGVLCDMQVQPLQNQSESELEQLINAVCWLLSLSQRTHVSCVTTHWKDKTGKIIKSVYKTPPFYYSTPSGDPLIPDDCLAEFLEKSMDNYQQKISNWNLLQAIEYYLQAMQINSMWAKSLGYFTALETLKSAFLKNSNPKLSKYYVSTNKFSKIKDLVIYILCKKFIEFKTILTTTANESGDTEQNEIRQSIGAKIEDLNRRAYKTILQEMFKKLEFEVAPDDLTQLIRLRNQIIHDGVPKYTDKQSFEDALKNVPLFCGKLIEPSFMAILGYQGKINEYKIYFKKLRD